MIPSKWMTWIKGGVGHRTDKATGADFTNR